MQKTVLIVDDSRVARMSLKKALLPHDVDITEFASAEEAFDYLDTASSYPEAIFMDVMMAGMDGLTATKKIKATPNLKTIPVVICTGNQGELDDKNALTSGAMAVLAKPPVPDAVNDIMRKLRQPEVAAVQSQPQSVEAKVDQATLTDKVVNIVEQKILPKMTQQAQQIVMELGQKTSAEIIEQQLAGKVQTELDALLPSVQMQLLNTVKQEVMVAIQPVITQQVAEAIALKAQQTIDALVNDIDVSKQAADALVVEAQTWLATQERQLQVDLGKEIGRKVSSAVDQHLNASLTEMVAPLVSLQVGKQLATQDLADNTEQLAQLTKRASHLQNLMVGLALSVVVLAVFVLL